MAGCLEECWKFPVENPFDGQSIYQQFTFLPTQFFWSHYFIIFKRPLVIQCPSSVAAANYLSPCTIKSRFPEVTFSPVLMYQEQYANQCPLIYQASFLQFKPNKARSSNN